MMNKQVTLKNTKEVLVDRNMLAPTDKETIAVLFAILESLSANVMSPDVWWLSLHSAQQMAIKKYGISEEMVNTVIDKFEKARKPITKGNPLSKMFE